MRSPARTGSNAVASLARTEGQAMAEYALIMLAVFVAVAVGVLAYGVGLGAFWGGIVEVIG